MALKKFHTGFIVLFSFLCLFSGCYDAEDIDHRMIISHIGIDAAPAEKILLTVRMPLVAAGRGRSAEPAKPDSYIIRTTLCSSNQEGLSEIQSREEHGLFIGQCRAVIFGESLAKQGLKPYLDFLNRLPMFPPSAYIVIARPTAEEILKIEWPETELHDQNIRMFFANRENQVPPIKRWSLFQAIYDPLKDPVVPLAIPSDDYTTMKILGLALFKDDRMVGELNFEESVLIGFLKNIKGKYGIKIPVRAVVGNAFHPVSGKTKIKVSFRNNQPQFKVSIKLHAFLTELGDYQSPISTRELKEVEQESARYLQREFRSLLLKLQTYGCDPINLGDHFRVQQSKYYSNNKWPEHYRQAKFLVYVKFHIERLGVLR